jgi:hypothetical protein
MMGRTPIIPPFLPAVSGVQSVEKRYEIMHVNWFSPFVPFGMF